MKKNDFMILYSMEDNDFKILYVLVPVIVMILIVVAIYGSLLRKVKTYASKQAQTESVYDAKFHGFEWRGHKYLKYGGSTNPSVLHDPDCPCWTNRLEAVK